MILVLSQSISGGLFDFDSLNEGIAINEQKMAEPGFWDNQEQAQSLINDTNRMKEKSENFKQLEAKFDDAQTALELLKADPDPELSEELSEEMVSLSQSFHD